MPNERLTRKQKALVKELRELAEAFNLDYENILSYEPEARTATLKLMRDKIVRAQVLMWYTLVDECLNNAICHYFFGRKRSFPALWKTKHFQVFNYYILEELYLLPKLHLVKAIRKVPNSVSNDILALNTLRNAVAHAFFPENLRKAKPLWKGKNIFSSEGASVFQADMHKLADYFWGSGGFV
jgi:hypothetical protein